MDGMSYNDSDILTKERMKRMVLALSISYGHLRIGEKEVGQLMAHWDKKDLMEMIGFIADVYQVPRSLVKIALGRRSEALNGDAHAEVRVGFRGEKHRISHTQTPKQILAGKCETFVYSIVHEMSHIRLHTDRHELRESEVATDLLCLVLGFDGFYKALRREYVLGRVGYIPFQITGAVYAEVEQHAGVLYL